MEEQHTNIRSASPLFGLLIVIIGYYDENKNISGFQDRER